MNTMELVRFVSTGERPRPSSPRATTAPFYSELIRPARQAILRARQYLLSEQRHDGSWLGVQSCDASLASQLVLFLAYRGQEETKLAHQAAATILGQQMPGGGWPLVPGGPADLSTSVQAYFALKLSGLEPGDERLSRARVAIRRLGGADAADTETRFWLALLGQVDYDCCPAISPELLRFHGRRAAVLNSLATVWSHRAVRHVGVERGARELFVKSPCNWSTARYTSRLGSMVQSAFVFFWGLCERLGWTPFRGRALNRAEAELLRDIGSAHIGRLSFSELIWHTVAIHAIGFQENSGELQACDQRLRELIQMDDDLELAQPQLRTSPLGDTATVLHSLGASGMAPKHPSVGGGLGWLSALRRPTAFPACTLELASILALLREAAAGESAAADSLPPDIDLDRRFSKRNPTRRPGRQARAGRVIGALIRRLLDQQNADGGWSVKTGNKSSPDITGAVLTSLAADQGNATAVGENRAIEYLRRTQRADGSWDSAAGVRLIHGTSLAVRGLLAAGIPAGDEAIAAGINWLLVHQQTSGGWGEAPSTTSDAATNEYIQGPATASQTAWALLALVAAGRANTPAVRRGIDFLIETQREDGRWHEPQFLLHDAASGRWFNSNLHTVAAPLLALSRWTVSATAGQANRSGQISLRLVGAAADD